MLLWSNGIRNAPQHGLAALLPILHEKDLKQLLQMCFLFGEKISLRERTPDRCEQVSIVIRTMIANCLFHVAQDQRIVNITVGPMVLLEF